MTTAKKYNIWFLSGWYPSRVHTTRGNFVQKHAEAAARYCNVAVLHVCTDPGLKQRQEISYSEEKGLRELIIYLNPSTRIPGLAQIIKYFRFRNAYRKGSRLLQKQFGSPDFIHSAIVYPVTFFARMLARNFRISYGIEEHWTGYLPADPLKPSAFSLLISKRFVKKPL